MQPIGLACEEGLYLCKSCVGSSGMIIFSICCRCAASAHPWTACAVIS